MGRALVVLHNDAMRAKAAGWIARAPKETRVTFQGPKRTLPQNDKMWAMLTEVSEQATWAGKRRSPNDWKDLFTGAVKMAGDARLEAVPGLEGGLMILGLHTSEMDAPEMVELIDYMEAWGAQNGVTFSTPSTPARAPEALTTSPGGGE